MEKRWPRRHEPQGAERWFSAESEQGKISTGPAVSWGRRSGSSPSASCTAGAPSFRADLRLGFRCADGGDDDRTVRRRGRGGHLSSDRCAASLRTPASRTIGSGPRRNDLRTFGGRGSRRTTSGCRARRWRRAWCRRTPGRGPCSCCCRESPNATGRPGAVDRAAIVSEALWTRRGGVPRQRRRTSGRPCSTAGTRRR